MSVPATSWWVEKYKGSAAEFHARPVDDEPDAEVWMLSVSRPALVLGSSQRDDIVDTDACQARGIDIVRRRSGGGAVLLVPGEVLWVDVIVPSGHPRWDADVAKATWWLGEAWAAALGGGDVHREPLCKTRWGSVVCFGALGPGEVSIDGRKVVGISQRRTRSAARFQCAVLGRWDAGEICSLLRLDDPSAAVADLAQVAGGVSLSGLGDRFLAAI
ncbi:MAG: biotin/lipoate A/B protein ligase family protein [Acidimicrobiia bacterium]